METPNTQHAPVVWPAILTPPCSGRHMDHSGDMEASEPRVPATGVRPIPVGEKYGRLTVIGDGGHSAAGNTLVLCRCDCGATRTARLINLKNNHIKSCGCLQRESRIKHGMHSSGAYWSWNAMISRCNDPGDIAFARYGGRGITVCDRWRDSIAAFVADMGPRPSPQHSIDRIDVNGNYEPGNCRWATNKEQGRNRRNNHIVTVSGTSRTITEWAEITGANRQTIQRRLDRGWPPEAAILPSTRRGRAK